MNRFRSRGMNHGKQFLALAASGALLFLTPDLHAQDAPDAQDAQEAAFLRELTGTVEIMAPGSAVWTRAVAGDRIEKSAIISTGFKSTAVVTLGDSVLTVRPLTRLSLEEIVSDRGREQVDLYLQTGRIRADVKPPVGGTTEFTVRSPVGSASVRGTSFEFDTERLRVDEGRVQYSLVNGREALVAAGGISYVDETSNTLISPFEAAAELLAPAPPAGSGGPSGDTAPAIPPPPAAVGLGFGWD
jgi:ferric-dicitrate binding protein FerR (iron transport regulator)